MRAREAFKSQFAGHCFRCLASDHRVAQCRDPVRCSKYRGIGHISRVCLSRRLHRRPISAELRSRLTFPPDNIHSRLIFPPLHSQGQTTSATKPHLPPWPPPTVDPEMDHVPGFAPNHPTRSSVAMVATDAMTHEANRLLLHGVVITTPLRDTIPTPLSWAML